MSDHDVRHALATFADTTPFLDPKDGLAERLARRARARRAAIAATACFAAVVAGTGVAALTRDRGTAAGVVAADDPSSPTPTGEAPSSEPSPLSSGEPTADPSPGGTEPTAGPSGSADPAPPAKPIVRTAGGPDGLRVKVTLDPGSLPTATTAALTVEAEDDDGEPQVVGLSWGDGSAEMIAVVAADCVSRRPPLLGSPSPRSPSPGEAKATYDHAWRHAGRHTVTVTVRSSVWCANDDPPVEEHTIKIDLDVAPGRVTSNGPAAPRVEGLEWEPSMDDDRTVLLFGRLRDHDGTISSYTVDWGDGSEPTTVREEDECDDGDGRYYPAGYGVVDLDHTYAESGSYRVTVTVTSTGCEGRDPQRETATIDTAA